MLLFNGFGIRCVLNVVFLFSLFSLYVVDDLNGILRTFSVDLASALVRWRNVRSECPSHVTHTENTKSFFKYGCCVNTTINVNGMNGHDIQNRDGNAEQCTISHVFFFIPSIDCMKRQCCTRHYRSFHHSIWWFCDPELVFE